MYQSGIQMWNPSVEHFRLLLLFLFMICVQGAMGRQHSVLRGYPHHHIYYVSVCMYLFFANVMVIANKYSFIHSCPLKVLLYAESERILRYIEIFEIQYSLDRGLHVLNCLICNIHAWPYIWTKLAPLSLSVVDFPIFILAGCVI